MRFKFIKKKKFKEVEIWEGTKNMEIPHILANLLVFLDFDFFGA